MSVGETYGLVAVSGSRTDVEVVKLGCGLAKVNIVILAAYPGDILKEDIYDLFNEQKGKCILDGHELTHNAKPDPDSTKHIVESHSRNISVDRKDPTLSYLRHNVQLVCNRCNISKWMMQHEEFIDLCRKVDDHSLHISPGEKDQIDPTTLRIDSSFKKVVKKCFSNLIGRNRDVEITKEDIIDLYIKQRGRCALSNVKMTYISTPDFKKVKRINMSHFHNLSVDRIDSSKGYVLNNIQLVIMKVNYSKLDLDQNDYISLCKEIALHHDNNQTF